MFAKGMFTFLYALRFLLWVVRWIDILYAWCPVRSSSTGGMRSIFIREMPTAEKVPTAGTRRKTEGATSLSQSTNKTARPDKLS